MYWEKGEEIFFIIKTKKIIDCNVWQVLRCKHCEQSIGLIQTEEEGDLINNQGKTKNLFLLFFYFITT